MPDHERDEIIKIVKDAIKAEINSRIVNFLGWILTAMLANLGVLGTGLWMFWTVTQNMEATKSFAQHDRWTGTMEQVAEYERGKTTGYIQVDVRAIQAKYPPQ